MDNDYSRRQLRAQLRSTSGSSYILSGCFLVVQQIKKWLTPSTIDILFLAVGSGVPGAQKNSTVARVKSCYVACSKHGFLPWTVIIAEDSCERSYAALPHQSTSFWVFSWLFFKLKNSSPRSRRLPALLRGGSLAAAERALEPCSAPKL